MDMRPVSVFQTRLTWLPSVHRFAIRKSYYTSVRGGENGSIAQYRTRYYDLKLNFHAMIGYILLLVALVATLLLGRLFSPYIAASLALLSLAAGGSLIRVGGPLLKPGSPIEGQPIDALLDETQSVADVIPRTDALDIEHLRSLEAEELVPEMVDAAKGIADLVQRLEWITEMPFDREATHIYQRAAAHELRRAAERMKVIRTSVTERIDSGHWPPLLPPPNDYINAAAEVAAAAAALEIGTRQATAMVSADFGTALRRAMDAVNALGPGVLGGGVSPAWQATEDRLQAFLETLSPRDRDVLLYMLLRDAVERHRVTDVEEDG